MKAWRFYDTHDYRLEEIPIPQVKEGWVLLKTKVFQLSVSEISRIKGTQVIPLGELSSRLSELDPADEIVLICKAGVRSRRALHILLGAGYRKVHNLKGGLNAWAKDIDPTQPIY